MEIRAKENIFYRLFVPLLIFLSIHVLTVLVFNIEKQPDLSKCKFCSYSLCHFSTLFIVKVGNLRMSSSSV